MRHNRFSVEVGFGARFMFRQFGININYQIGLVDLCSYDHIVDRINRFNAGLSYTF